MNGTVYFDTSALAKWYLNERRSEDVERYIRAHGPVSISTLTVVEMRSLLARRRRERSIDARTEMRVWGTFEEDVRLGFLIRHPLEDGVVASAAHLLAVAARVPLRTLDVLHLAVAREIQANAVATADKVQAAGAQALGLSVVRFD